MQNFYQLSAQQSLKELNTNKDGLTHEEAKKRLEQFGLNELKTIGVMPWYKIFLRQFVNIMVIILIFAMGISFLVGEYIDAIAILAIIILNAIIGFVQEYKAEKAIEALKKMSSPHALVIRDKQSIRINATELVPGDILILEEGMRIPADSRLLSEAEIRTDESSLTGESTPTSKITEPIKGDKSIGDKKNMLFMGTIIVRGHGTAVVTTTGMNTEFGQIANLVQIEKPGLTPLQKKLNHLSKVLAALVIGIAVILFASSLITGRDPIEMLILSISLAVSVIPEGLAAVITLTLAISVQQMSKKNALVRILPAAETLGSTSVICTDKTGTLTENAMTVTNIYIDNKNISVTGVGYTPEGEFFEGENQISIKQNPSLEKLLEIAILCNNAHLFIQKNEWKIVGDPTEASLLTLGRKGNLSYETCEKKYPRQEEFVFDSDRKRMSTINKYKAQNFLLTKGAPDSILDISSHILINGKVEKLTHSKKQQILKTNDAYAKNALRVLGFAYKPIKTAKPAEEDMIFVGLVGMIDPPRKEVKDAILKCENAHIAVKMITGDYPLTAKAIGSAIGLYKKGDKIITGTELEKMTQKELNNIVDGVKIFARVNPHHKVKILKALKYKGHIVAMTGDGVNDAPALKSADIGIAMGISGTDVAKEASAMILTDDNFASIVASVESGRRIFRNIKKFIRYLLSANFDEVLVISIVFALGYPIPFLPLQLLWVNILTDALPAVALGLDPADDDLMELKPRNPKASIFKELLSFSIFAGVLSTVISIIIFFDSIKTDSIEYTRTLLFTTIVIFELLLVFSVRSENRHYFVNFFKNKFLLFGVMISLALQIMVIYTPFFQTIFKTQPLTGKDWIFILTPCILAIIIIEIWKKFRKPPLHV